MPGSARTNVWLAWVLASAGVVAGCGSSSSGGTSPIDDASPIDAAIDMGAGDAGDAASGDASDGATSPDAAEVGLPDADGGVVPGSVRYLGRVDAHDPAGVEFAWSATGLIATVQGTKLSVKLRSKGSDAFFQPVVDGKAGARFSVASGATQTVTLASGLAAGDHVVELYRESEGMYGSSVFLGFVDGVVKGAPAGSGRLIEVIGDSISAGYGNLGVEVHPPWDNACTFSLATESAYQSYASILGRTLNAEVSIIARSGWGAYRDGDGNTSGVLSSVYANTLGTDGTLKWAFARKADAVVVNLGTNDAVKGDPGKPYEDALLALLGTVRSKNPGAWIFVTLGTMTSDPLLTTMRGYIKSALGRFGDAKATSIDLSVQDATSTGCDYHPNVAEDQRIAAALSPTIKSKLGWCARAPASAPARRMRSFPRVRAGRARGPRSAAARAPSLEARVGGARVAARPFARRLRAARDATRSEPHRRRRRAAPSSPFERRRAGPADAQVRRGRARQAPPRRHRAGRLEGGLREPRVGRGARAAHAERHA
jgi:lysophospholipase L1-like esterase